MAREKNWESFIESDLLNFLEKHDLQSITVDDGNRKGSVKKDGKGQIKVSFSSSKIL